MSNATLVKPQVVEGESPTPRVKNYWSDVATKVLSDPSSGWKAVTDPKSGRTYYSNKRLNKTTWNLEKELYTQYLERKKEKQNQQLQQQDKQQNGGNTIGGGDPTVASEADLEEL